MQSVVMNNRREHSWSRSHSHRWLGQYRIVRRPKKKECVSECSSNTTTIQLKHRITIFSNEPKWHLQWRDSKCIARTSNQQNQNTQFEVGRFVLLSNSHIEKNVDTKFLRFAVSQAKWNVFPNVNCVVGGLEQWTKWKAKLNLVEYVSVAFRMQFDVWRLDICSVEKHTKRTVKLTRHNHSDSQCISAKRKTKSHANTNRFYDTFFVHSEFLC